MEISVQFIFKDFSTAKITVYLKFNYGYNEVLCWYSAEANYLVFKKDDLTQNGGLSRESHARVSFCVIFQWADGQ